MTIEEMFEIIEATELRMSEVADLFRIAHSTLYDWRNGACRPKNEILFDHACGIASRFPQTTLEWDAKALAFKNVKEANQFVKRTYRKGWEVKGLS